MNDTLLNFNDALTAEGLSDNTRRAYIADIRGYLQWANVPDPPRTAASDYLNALRQDRLANSTINRKATALRKFYGDALEKYKLPPAPNGEPHPLPDLMKDVRRMLHVTTGEVRLAIALMGFGGLRVSETLALRWVDITDDEITVYGKGSKIRRVPVAPELAAAVTRSLGNQLPPLGAHDRLIHMSERGLRKAVTLAGSRAGIGRPVASHDLRMTFGTVVYNFCKDLRVVQELLGHASSKTTERYTGVTQAARSAAVTGAMP